MSAREELAAVLAEHRMYVSEEGDDWHEPAEEALYCSCDPDEELGGWVHTAEDHVPPNWDAIHEAHVADALLASPALARVIREARGQAWREGVGLARIANEGLVETLARNPYRDEQP